MEQKSEITVEELVTIIEDIHEHIAKEEYMQINFYISNLLLEYPNNISVIRVILLAVKDAKPNLIVGAWTGTLFRRFKDLTGHELK